MVLWCNQTLKLLAIKTFGSNITQSIATAVGSMYRVIVALLLLTVLWSLVTEAGTLEFQDLKKAHDYVVSAYKLYQLIWGK